MDDRCLARPAGARVGRHDCVANLAKNTIPCGLRLVLPAYAGSERDRISDEVHWHDLILSPESARVYILDLESV